MRKSKTPTQNYEEANARIALSAAAQAADFRRSVELEKQKIAILRAMLRVLVKIGNKVSQWK